MNLTPPSPSASQSEPTLGLIVAVSPDGVIGKDNAIPWHHPADLSRFKALTMNATLVMGRKTFASIGRPLPGRRNVVLCSRPIEAEVEVFSSLKSALQACSGPTWIIGGALVYQESLPYAHFIDRTLVPDRVDRDGAVLFPELDPEDWTVQSLHQNPEHPELWHQRLVRLNSPRTPV